VRFALVEAAAGSSEVLCSDHFVTMERDGEWDEAYASWALPMVVHIARALEAARSHVPPATKLMQLAHGYEKAARQLQLTWMATPLALGGDIDGIQVFAHASRLQQGTYGTVVHARFPASLGLGMSIKPRLGSTFLDMFADKDIQVGDAPFDEAFDLHGAEAERIVEALTADVRRELFALREQGTVHLTDMGIELHVQRIPQASEVPALVARMSDLAKLVLANVRSPDAVKGPYR
jgi:hypothetical protein